jgi:glycosyltransferase involved in cell wall biosynthesis
MAVIDVFIDFSRVSPDFRLAAAMARLDSPELLGCIAERVTCAVPSDYSRGSGIRQPNGWRIRTTRPVASCSHAIAAAADAERPLLVLLGDIEPGCDALGVLLEAIDADPMIGFVLPRLRGSGHDSLARLDTAGDQAIDELPRRLLSEIPDTYLVADAPARCLLIKPVVLANFGALDERFRSLAAALWQYVGRARRCGFRTLVCNRAVVAAAYAARPCPPCTITFRSLSEADRVLLRELLPDVERAREEFGTSAVAPAETRLARALPHAYGMPPSLLLDARNIIAGMNGTAMAALGISRGLYALGSEWDVTLLASRDACTFHNLEQSFPDWQVSTTLPERQFTVALRLSQPWHIQQMIDLHAASAYNVYLFLDTISWDIAYQAPRQLEGTWQFMADHADGFLFNSAFTRDRLYRRFPTGAAVPGLVAHHSFNPVEYIHPDVPLSPDEGSVIFIIGNEYDHKDVSPTIELLSSAFPYQPIVALGPQTAAAPRVTVLQSGRLSELEINRLYAGARVVVFPSFYEGFGFPILTTLAYGRTLLARRSALLDEIAARCVRRGRVVPFDRRDELVELIGRLLHGRDVTELPLGTALENGRPKSWQDVGESIMTFLTDLIGDLSRSRWRAREHAIRQLMAAPISLIDKGLKWPSVDSGGDSASGNVESSDAGDSA